MANFRPSATGKLFTPTSDAPIERAFERMGEQILQGERMKLQHALNEEADFLRMTDVDPVALTNMESTKRQSAAMEAFNSKWQNIYKGKQGKLTTADKSVLQADRQVLVGLQNKELANQQNWLRDYEMYRRNPDAYDQDTWEGASIKWKNSGEYPVSALEPSAIDPVAYLSKNITRTGKQQAGVESISGGYKSSYTQYGDETSAGNDIKHAFLMGGDRVLKGLIKDFNNAPIKEKKVYLDMADENNNGLIDPNEMGRGKNAILEWAANNEGYVNIALNRKYNVPRKKGTTDTQAKPVKVIVAGKSYNIHPVEISNIPIGKKRRDIYMFNIGAQSVNLAGGHKSNGDPIEEEYIKTRAMVVEGYLPEDDEVLYRVPRDAGDFAAWKDDNVFVPRKNAPQWINDLPIYYNGKATTIGEITKGKKPSSGKKRKLY